MLEDVVWNVRDGIEEVEDEILQRKFDIGEHGGNEYVFLSFQVDRYGELDRVELMYNIRDATVQHILTHIQRFYTSRIENKQDYIELEDPYSSLVSESLDGTVVYLEEVMGDCMFFEGLNLVRNLDGNVRNEDVPIYRVELGS